MLTIAHFMLGCAHLKKGLNGKALQDFENAYFFLRGNRLIDYKQLGLKYKLYLCEVMFLLNLYLLININKWYNQIHFYPCKVCKAVDMSHFNLTLSKPNPGLIILIKPSITFVKYHC